MKKKNIFRMRFVYWVEGCMKNKPRASIRVSHGNVVYFRCVASCSDNANIMSNIHHILYQFSFSQLLLWRAEPCTENSSPLILKWQAPFLNVFKICFLFFFRFKLEKEIDRDTQKKKIVPYILDFSFVCHNETLQTHGKY